MRSVSVSSAWDRQRMDTEVGQPDTGWKLVDHQRLGRARQHRLTAMKQVPQPRGPVDRRSDVVALPASLAAQLHLAGVNPDPHLDLRQRRPL